MVALASWLFMLNTVLCYKLDYIGQSGLAQASSGVHFLVCVGVFLAFSPGAGLYGWLAVLEIPVFLLTLVSCLQQWRTPEYTLFGDTRQLGDAQGPSLQGGPIRASTTSRNKSWRQELYTDLRASRSRAETAPAGPRDEDYSMVDVAIVAESTYPYLRGGVSAVVQDIVEGNPESTFGIIHIAWDSNSPSTALYQVPPNVLWVRPVFLACRSTATTSRGFGARRSACPGLRGPGSHIAFTTLSSPFSPEKWNPRGSSTTRA